MSKFFAVLGWINLTFATLFMIAHVRGWQPPNESFRSLDTSMMASVAAMFAIACYYKES